MLADEVGLGKTVEAGLALCQYWAERRRKLLVICPASIRKQWSLELHEKFNLPNKVIDAKAFRQAEATGNLMTTTDGVPLKVSLRRAMRRNRIKATLLAAPLLVFILITFIIPIVNMSWRSVDNPETQQQLLDAWRKTRSACRRKT